MRVLRACKLLPATLIATLPVLAGSRAIADPIYKVTDIEPAVDTLFPFSTYLNNNGQVAGTWTVPPGNWNPGGTFPFLYDPAAGGKVTLLGMTSPSGQNTGSVDWQGGATGVNDQGQVIGRNDTVGHTFVYDSRTGQTTYVPVPAGSISNSGEIVATQEDAPVNGLPNSHPVAYQNGAVTNLGTPPGAIGAYVVAANGAGPVLISAATAPGRFNQDYLLSGGKWTSLGVPSASAVNAQGDVAGSINTAGNLTHAFLLPHGGSLIDLGTLPGDATSIAIGMNNQGAVVGLSIPSANRSDLYRGFLYQDGVMKDINSLISAGSGWTIRYGLSINDKGQILALADNPTREHLVLLTPDSLPTPPDAVLPAMPVPEPSTVVVFSGLGVAFLWRSLRRRAA
jgi:probable HAF family extracellular repeat protein